MNFNFWKLLPEKLRMFKYNLIWFRFFLCIKKLEFGLIKLE